MRSTAPLQASMHSFQRNPEHSHPKALHCLSFTAPPIRARNNEHLALTYVLCSGHNPSKDKQS